MRVLIAGGSGLIGGPATRALLARGHEVTVLARGTHVAPAGARLLVADRGDASALAAALAGRTFDVVLDLLAFDAPDVARLFAVPALAFARYLVISTGQVYLVAAERTPPFAEADAVKPPIDEPEAGTRDHANWEYGMGKRRMEDAVRALAAARGVHATALRLPVVQGANDPSRRLWAYLQRLRDGGPLLLPEGGRHPVRFVWAEDVARAVVALAEGAGTSAFAYNLAQPDEPQLIDLVGAMADALGIVPRIVECSWEDIDRAGLDPRFSPYSGRWCSRPDPSLAGRDLGFTASPTAVWLPEVVRAHLAEPDPRPHDTYARRAVERALAATIAAR